MIKLIGIFCIWTVVGIAANINIEASVDRSEVNVGDRITYSITLTGTTDFDKLQLPRFVGFDIVSGPATSTQIELINGRMSRSGTHSYVLVAIKKGTLLIPPAAFKKTRRKSIRSNSITIKVNTAAQSPKNSYNRSNKGGSVSSRRTLPEVFLEAKIDQDSVYRFEMVTVSYNLFFKVDVSNYSFPKLPNATGFWQEDFKLPQRPKIRDEIVFGVPYKVATIRKIGLFPTRTGKLTLAPLTTDITVELPRRRRSRRGSSIFDDPFFGRAASEVRSVSTNKIYLTVLELPTAGKPVNFKGDVGKFKLNVTYDKAEITQHDALNIEITISGTGYVKSISAPKLTLPAGFEVFDPMVEARIKLSGQQMRGKKVFKYLVIPRRIGNFKLPPVRFSYFDAEAGAYRRIKSGGREIVITPSARDEFLSGSGMTPEEVTLLGSDIRYIKELTTPLTPIKSKSYSSPWFMAAMAFSPIVFLLGLGAENIVQKYFSDPAAVRLRSASVMMKRTLKNAGELIEKGEITASAVLLSQNLSELVGAIIREPGAGLTRYSVESGLKEIKFDTEVIETITSLLDEADTIRFSGVKLDELQAMNLLERFRDTATELEKLT